MLVSICICTYGRPSVANTIQSVLQQTSVPLTDIEVIVCDEDDPEKSAERLISDISEQSAIPIQYIVSSGKSIVNCRNALLSAARAEWIAFLDDDQTADSSWLSELLTAQRQFNADVVKSFVRAVYPPNSPKWALMC